MTNGLGCWVTKKTCRIEAFATNSLIYVCIYFLPLSTYNVRVTQITVPQKHCPHFDIGCVYFFEQDKGVS